MGQVAHSSGIDITAQTYRLAVQRAWVLSYLDAFKAVALLFLLLLPFLLLVKPGAANAHAHAHARPLAKSDRASVRGAPL